MALQCCGAPRQVALTSPENTRRQEVRWAFTRTTGNGKGVRAGDRRLDGLLPQKDVNSASDRTIRKQREHVGRKYTRAGHTERTC